MKLCIVLGSLCAIACATPSIKRDKIGLTYTADERLSHYVTEFLVDCRALLGESICSPPISLQVTIAPLDDTTLGMCSVYPYSGRRLVEIDPAIVGQYNERIVTYHELFHCILGRPHYDGEMDIMNTYEIEENTKAIYLNWREYVRAVFIRK